MTDNIPWVEKYRPQDIDHVVLTQSNRTILENMISKQQLANILLYGPPGTGKTTTILNFIKLYQETNDEMNKDLVIHLNASDDRGIEIIRNQIMQFVRTKNLFNKGMKFIILDEIDYMTSNAQIALKNLIQIMNKENNNVVFCLIGNYLSKIAPQLQNMCIHMRFNQLPKNKITSLLSNICKKEGLEYTKEYYIQLIDYFKSDIRSMINYIQLNQSTNKKCVLTNNMIKDIIQNLIESDIDKGIQLIENTMIETNTSIVTFLENLTFYIFEKHFLAIKNSDFYNSIQFIFQSETLETRFIMELYLSSLKSSLNNSLL